MIYENKYFIVLAKFPHCVDYLGGGTPPLRSLLKQGHRDYL